MTTIDTKKLAELEGVDAEGLDAPAESVTTERAEPIAPPPQTTLERNQHIRVGNGYARTYGQQCATVHAGFGARVIGGGRDTRKI